MKYGLIVIPFLAVAAPALGGHVITADEHTRMALSSAQMRILNYVAEHHRLPKTLSEVPERAGYADEPVDGWGRPLVYEPQSDGSIVLRSLGKEGGGHARTIRFPTADSAEERHSHAIGFTFDKMDNIEFFLIHFAKDHGHLPDVLPSSYPEPQGLHPEYDCVDSWGGPISYARKADGSVLLASKGKDGKQMISVEFAVLGPVSNAATTAPSSRPI